MSRLNENRKSHYGSSMNPHYMAEWGRTIAKEVDAIIADGKFPILVYRGMSGTTAATAISMFVAKTDTVDYATVYVRKKNEKSHGNAIEHSRIILANRQPVWIICDDFISSGTTALEVLKAITAFFKIEIPFHSVRYALSLDDRFICANTINDVETSVRSVTSIDDATAIVKCMKQKYNRFLNAQRNKQKEVDARIISSMRNARKRREAEACQVDGLDLTDCPT